jgi:hypothetical protein
MSNKNKVLKVENSIGEHTHQSNLKEIISINEHNSQRRFEQIEVQMQQLIATVNRLAESINQQTISQTEFKGISHRIFDRIDTLENDSKKLEKEIRHIKASSTNNSVMLTLITTAAKIIFTAFIGGAIATYWLIVRNSGGA